jgi:hypothetical protein
MSELYWLDGKCDLYVGTSDIVRFGVFALLVTSARIVPKDYELSEIIVLCPVHDDSVANAPFALVVGISPFDLIANLVPIEGYRRSCLNCQCCHSMPAFRCYDLIQHTIGYLV